MAKSKLEETTKDFIEKKSEESENKSKYKKEEDVKMTTFYISKKSSKLLWYHKIETGENLSQTVDRLILKNFAK